MVAGQKKVSGMRIGIDGRMWDESGIGRYIRNLVINLAKIDHKNKYYIFLLTKNLGQKLPSNFQEIGVDFTWYGLFEQLKFPWLLAKYRLDLVHFPHFNIPLFYFGKFVVTIHDLIHQHYSMQQSTTLNPVIYKIKKIGYGLIFDTAVKSAKYILTPSQFTRNQLVDEYRVDGRRINVTHEAVDDMIAGSVSSVSEKSFQEISNKFEIKKPYLFYIGNAHPHKNLVRLVLVFRQIKIIHPEIQLVLSGKRNYFWDKLKKLICDEGVQDIIFTGSISDHELVALYKNSLAYVFPSLEEGFGLPLLEAMACQAPVIASRIGSLVEIGGEAAFYFDPKDEIDMKDKILQVIENSRLRKILITRGDKRVKQYSWEKLAQHTLEVYKQCG